MGLDRDSGDDFGLPHVDIVVPDDARELDRDVIAYRREVRQRRRRERMYRIVRPFLRYGIAAPFIAGAVVIALVSGVLMTVATPRSGETAAPRVTPAIVTATQGRGAVVLPRATLTVAGKPMSLGRLHPGILLIIPPDCHCGETVTRLTAQATGQHVRIWLVADGRSGKGAGDVRALAAGAAGGQAAVVDDPGRVLSSAYRADGLTAVLVEWNGDVLTVRRDVPADADLTKALEDLRMKKSAAPTTTTSH